LFDPMASRTLQTVPLILSLVAVVVATIAVMRRSDPPIVQPTGGDVRDREIRELSDQIAELRVKIEGLNRAPLDTSARQPAVEATPTAPADLTALDKRLTDLEAAVLHNKAEHWTARDVLSTEDLLSARRTALDHRATDQQKLDALKILRRGHQIDGQPAISHDVVLAMLDVVNHSADESVRTFVYANLHGVNDPVVRDAMLRDLANDPSAQVREKIAGDINTFSTDPAVQDALRLAAANDPDASVRQAASATLAWKPRR
jgi:hypothetical protein